MGIRHQLRLLNEKFRAICTHFKVMVMAKKKTKKQNKTNLNETRRHFLIIDCFKTMLSKPSKFMMVLKSFNFFFHLSSL